MGVQPVYRYELEIMWPGETEFVHSTFAEDMEKVERHIANNSKRYSWRITDRDTGVTEVRTAKHRLPRKNK